MFRFHVWLPHLLYPATTPPKMTSDDPRAFNTRYLDALRVYYKDATAEALRAAVVLGQDAAADGLGRQEMAKIHDEALTFILQPGCTPEHGRKVLSRTSSFFNTAIQAMENANTVAASDLLKVSAVNVELVQRTLDLAESHREVLEVTKQRKLSENALATNEAATVVLLKESQQLEDKLHEMTRNILSANEDEKKAISVKLQDEIAQTLLGIHVRMMALKGEVAANNEDLAREISITQRLVEESTASIRRYARELGLPTA